ncbi:ENTH domain-containing protein 1 isoform X4 [Equus caballus]|uniref:ENTH domain-containing protein 1 isoform X4 n=2 Tax=Equus caballus TaxID=9796 RepID=UPI000717D698|nr:ENTH domain-containing protein 1 isoform X4 [Equus caballus]
MAFRRQVKNFVKNYSDAEIKVREATSNDPWGPSSSLMLDISDLTFNTISLSEIMNMLWQRLKDHGKNWRHVYKSLTLMDYLIKNGSRKVIQHCREGFCNLQTLKDFQHVDEAGKDQGYYIREKSKQVITLLMDEQLLHKEREIACRTRRRTSYSMTFPKRVPGTGNSPTACASAPTPEIPASERKHKLLKVARLCNKSLESKLGVFLLSWRLYLVMHFSLFHKKTFKKSFENASKAGLKQQQCQDAQLPSGTALSQETLPFKINAWKSTEDLMLFCEDDPQPLWPAIPPAILAPTTWLSEGQADICHLWNADAVSPPSFVLSEKSPSLQTNASVETLYVSPSFNVFDPVKEMVINKDCQKPAESSVVQMEEENLKTLTAWVSTASEGTSSFSTLSMSSPDSASPGKSVHLLPPILARPSFWTLSHQTSSSASFKDKDKATSAHHPFAPGGPVSSDEEENDNLNLLEILPDNSDSAQKKSHISSSNWVEFSTQTVDPFTSMSCSGFQTSKGLPREPEVKNSIKGLLGEVKNAIVKLHEDLSMVIQELNVINSHLVSMGGASPQISSSLQLPQSSEGGSDPV